MLFLYFFQYLQYSIKFIRYWEVNLLQKFLCRFRFHCLLLSDVRYLCWLFRGFLRKIFFKILQKPSLLWDIRLDSTPTIGKFYCSTICQYAFLRWPKTDIFLRFGFINFWLLFFNFFICVLRFFHLQFYFIYLFINHNFVSFTKNEM